ncbi:MAG: GNAT family N-acetyltransferase, partial [Ruminococcus sp.]|nr:GNAT family N-acetyltransferase [Ruminococcus sp.]
PLNFKLCEIRKELFYKINGNVTPLFSWDNVSEFFEKGKGYCIVNGENVAAWAFTAAISDEEIDIGIETRAEYQHCGLGAIVSDKMIQYCFQQHKRPVWACHSNNIASQKLAEKVGFVKVSECFTIKRR